MSTQKGNVKKSKPPKHQNKMGFKNSMHDTSRKTKSLNNMCIPGVCDKCRGVVEWKIKYKKYKVLTTAKKCTKCQQKAVKQSYMIICEACRDKEGVCAKCGVSLPDEKDPTESTGDTSSKERSSRTELPHPERDSVSQEGGTCSGPNHPSINDQYDSDGSEETKMKTDEEARSSVATTRQKVSWNDES